MISPEKEYTDEKGKVVKVVEWFGYKFHLLVDTRHEVSLAYRITPANVADCTVLPPHAATSPLPPPETRHRNRLGHASGLP